LKYFTKQLWLDLQRPGEVGATAGRRWDEALAAYRRELEGLRGRVPPAVFEFIDEARPHDGRLVDVRVRGFAPVARYQPRPGGRADAIDDDAEVEEPSRLTVDVSVEERSRVVWTLRYAGIRRFLADFPTATPLFRGQDFDDWGYDEFSDAGDGFLRHEVLFSSGSIVLVEFRDLSVERVDGPSPPTAT
jgi:hypothetical protein